MATRKNKLLEFIKEHEPKFEKQRDGSWQIFTVATQHVNKPTLEECIKFCYYVIEEKPILKYPTMSELCNAWRRGEFIGKEEGCCMVRHGDVGYQPGFTTVKEIGLWADLGDKMQEKQNEMLWNIKDT